MDDIKLPEFEKLFELVQEMKQLQFEISKLDIKIKYYESIIFREGKEHGQSVAYIENAFKFPGNDGELIELRLQLAEKEAELAAKKYELLLYRDMIEVWRTIQANNRLGLQS